MAKRTFKEIRKAILKILKDGKAHKYGDLERRANTNWQTIRDHCENLEYFGVIAISEDGVKLTKRGTALIRLKRGV